MGEFGAMIVTHYQRLLNYNTQMSSIIAVKASVVLGVGRNWLHAWNVKAMQLAKELSYDYKEEL